MTQKTPGRTRATAWAHAILFVLLALPGTGHAEVMLQHRFDVRASGEGVASITAGCAGCDWGVAGREAVALKLSLDGAYSQHLLLTRGEAPAEYRVLLGGLTSGPHQLTIERDVARSAKGAGDVRMGTVSIEVFGVDSPDHRWLSRAPFLHARPGSIERFSDVPLMMYVETGGAGHDAGSYRYTVIFSHEDGGTPTDRLMATWGRATDIELVYDVSPADANGAVREEYQGPDHELLPFRGRRDGTHPLLWVATDNNMFSDTGPGTAARFAPAPIVVTLGDASREAVMDSHPWMYAVMAAELRREGRIDPAAAPGSGTIPDPRQFAYLEACGDLQRSTVAFDIGVRLSGGEIAWHATDRGDARFRIQRSGCFRAAAPVPARVTPADLIAVRARAHTRPPREGETPLPPGAGRVTLRRVNAVLMLDDSFTPVKSALVWTGVLELNGESPPAEIPIGAR